MSIDALRNDAERMLRFIAADIESEQSRNEEVAKATGHGPPPAAGQLSAAHDHGVARAVARFSVIELVSEYRALRASVTRRWVDAEPITKESVAQLIRFNEAIDQILAEGVAKFTERMDRDADLFTGAIGHDLSNPVNAVAMSTRFLAASRNLSEAERGAVHRIERSIDRLSNMLVDLRDFTRTRLAGFLHVRRRECDVGAIIHNVVDELTTVYGTPRVSVNCGGHLVAYVDPRRLAQVVSNLVANALQHGPEDAQVKVSARASGDAVSIEVHNTGPAIDAQRLKTLFDPLTRSRETPDDARLGLGLYIAQQIARAHGGCVEVTSDEALGTRFTVSLPRSAAESDTTG